MAVSDSNGSKFFRLDLGRGFFSGILEYGFSVFVILISIRYFNAPDSCKAIIAGGSSLGLIFSPFLVSFWDRYSISKTLLCAFYMLACSIFIFFASFAENVFVFTFLLVIAQIFLSQIPSLMIRIYTILYKKGERGFRVSCTLMLSTFGGMATSHGLGIYLDVEGADHRMVLWALSFSALLCSVAHFLMPELKFHMEKSKSSINFLSILETPLQDRVFLKILIAWMILGFGVIMTFPLRVEYLADSKGLNLSNQEIALIGVSVFLLSKIISSLLWGRLFDHMHFIKFRIILNFLLISSILVYFNSNEFLGIAIGSALGGFAAGGAQVAWNLWVTKLAPSGKESEYMGLHMALTGLRGSTAPYFGYLLLKPLGFDGISILSACLVLSASLIFATTHGEKRFTNEFQN